MAAELQEAVIPLKRLGIGVNDKGLRVVDKKFLGSPTKMPETFFNSLKD